MEDRQYCLFLFGMMGSVWILAALMAATLESYAVGVRPTSVAVADFNRDGALDIAVANTGSGTVSVLLANRRRFQVAATFRGGPEPSDLEAADIDRDGDQDLVIANHETSSFTLLLNDGKAAFGPAPGSPFAMGARPHLHSVTVADFDGDGWMDVAVESVDTREVRLRRGGSRGFGPVIPVPVQTGPYFQLGRGDVTADGIADILIPGHSDRTVRAVAKRGRAFALAPFTLTLPSRPWAVTSGDFNGDGRTDLAALESDALNLWLHGTKEFSRAPSSSIRIPGATGIAVGKIDRAKGDDMVIGSWEGDQIAIVSGGSQRPRMLRVCERPVGLAVADLDRDGQGDIVVACATEARVVVIRNAAAQ